MNVNVMDVCMMTPRTNPSRDANVMKCCEIGCELTISATRDAVSKRVGKSSFEMKEFTDDGMSSWNQRREDVDATLDDEVQFYVL